MEDAPTAIYCFAASAAYPVWANARARRLAATAAELPPVAGRPLADLVERAVCAGRSETLSGRLGSDGPAATVVVRPMDVAGGPGALVMVEADGAGHHHNSGTFGDAVVEQVQHSLIPPALPLLPDLRLSGSYHPATSVRAAGGDWYDAVPLGGGWLALVVADAVGHGVPAAGAMGRLRGAMRSTAQRDPSPEAVLAALDAFAGQMEDVEGASVFYALVEVGTGRLTYTAAGHPPPLVVGPDGSTSFLPLTPRPPLGSPPGSAAPVSTYQLEQGATLVLFSDGAVATAEAPPTDGLSRLADVARRVLAEPGGLEGEASSGLAAAIAEGVRAPDGWLDDVAVLVAHRRATAVEPLQLDLSAQPAALPGVRRRLSAWLDGLGMGEQDRVGVMVAVGEACANAAEHAYRGTEPGPMSVRAQVDVDGVLTVIVRDRGVWRPPDRDPGDRGRGLLIMRQLVDGVTLVEDDGTTVTLTLRLRRAPEVDHQHGAAVAGSSVTVDRSVEPAVVRVTGAVDEFNAEQMRIRLLEASHGGTHRVELDLCDAGLFTSAAVRVVLAIARIATAEGWRLAVDAPEGGVTRHILQISGLGGLVDLR